MFSVNVDLCFLYPSRLYRSLCNLVSASLQSRKTLNSLVVCFA